MSAYTDIAEWVTFCDTYLAELNTINDGRQVRLARGCGVCVSSEVCCSRWSLCGRCRVCSVVRAVCSVTRSTHDHAPCGSWCDGSGVMLFRMPCRSSLLDVMLRRLLAACEARAHVGRR
jgi:hypothetical protein